jgi:hypothetical protein
VTWIDAVMGVGIGLVLGLMLLALYVVVGGAWDARRHLRADKNDGMGKL